MTDAGAASAATKPPSGRMKARAPPPPVAPQPAPRRIFNAAKSAGQGGTEAKENVLRQTVGLLITLPSGFQTTDTVSGSKALMDMLVDLCSQYHLNPAYHTLELQSPEGVPIAFKPNTLLGTLDVHKVLIKQKVAEEKVRRPPPKVPEKTVRLVVNYHRTQKAVVRVNPLVPLQKLVPVICEKCEFDPRHVTLLKDNISNKELDPSKSLSDLGIRELYVLDQSLEPVCSSSLSASASERKGIFGLFKFNKRKSKTEEQKDMDMDHTGDKNAHNSENDYAGSSTAPSTPAVNLRPNTLGQSQSVSNISRTSPKAEFKKRRAPPPPQALPGVQMAQRGSEGNIQVTPGSPNTNQQKKRKAPVPPATPAASCSLQTDEDSSEVSSNSSSTEEGEPAVSSTSTEQPEAASNDKMEEALNSTMEETESMLNYKMEETENNRHSTMGAARPVPLKPRRGNVRDPPHLVLPPPPPYPPPCLDKHYMDSHSSQPPDGKQESNMELVTQSWLRSVQGSRLDHKTEQDLAEMEEETVSTGSSGSLPDNAYAASEGTAEDSGVVSSPSDMAHPASPDDSLVMERQLSLDRSSSEADVQSQSNAGGVISKDFSSDSDEGCTTWMSHSRHNSDVCPVETQPVKNTDHCAEDLDLTAQLHQTLADLEADLAVIEHAEVATDSSPDPRGQIDTSCLGDIPISDLDMTVPVTTIDEVCEDYRYSMTDYAIAVSQPEREIKSGRRYQINSDLENKNNNAVTSNKQPNADNNGQIPRNDSEEKWRQIPATGFQFSTQKENEKQNILGLVKSPKAVSRVQKCPNDQAGTPKPQAVNQTEPKEHAEDGESLTSARWQTAQSKITQSYVSRLGMNTFTVVPPKPAYDQIRKPGGSLVTGAIKIDAQGNLINSNEAENQHRRLSGSCSDSRETLLGKAKAFWSSAEQHDPDNTSKTVVTKVKYLGAPNPEPSVPFSKKGPPEEAKSITVMEVKGDLSKDTSQGNKNEPFNLVPTNQPVKSMSKVESRNDLSFLKPPRRTSSQYVASAIAKYTGMPTTRSGSVKVDLGSTPASSAISQPSVSKPSIPTRQGFSNADRFRHVESNTQQSQVSTGLSKTVEATMLAANLRQSMSSPDYNTMSNFPMTTVKERDFAAEQNKSLNCKTVTVETNSVSPEANAKMKPISFQPCKPPPLQRPREEVQTLRSAPKVESAFGRSLHDPSTAQTIKKDLPEVTGKSNLRLRSAPSTPTDFNPPIPGGIFGPVKKFKPVSLKPLQNEASLHTSLMEAIQAGDGKQRLKKTSDTTRESTLKNTVFVEAENERSALLSAIRAQNNSSRLRKTKSSAAEELRDIKNTEETNGGQDTKVVPPSMPPPLPPSFPPPPPPPPPSANSSKMKPSNVTFNANGNPEQAREALLEAIRTGSGAARLKKVPVPSKTVLVNGRLGKVQLPSCPKD
ncbi:protein cordon-bleu isoform X2 [Amia ocellicauda]|uniref:protein cordon-bleu isoform X2 n=1 Tax=Amia ocellicauda TaxID=2972642 RepID=UPI0034648A8C